MSKVNLLFSILILLISLSCKKDNLQPAEGTLSLLTYNIAGLPEGISQSRPSKLTPIIGELINDYQIVHVQEDFNYNGKLYSNANHPYRTKWSGNAGFGDGLNTLSDFPIKDFKRFAWFNCNGTDCLTPKGFSYSKIEVAPKVYIDFYNVHCNAGSSNADLLARRQNMRQLADYINNNSKDEAVIVMGDFNCRYTRAGDRLVFLTEMGFRDPWVELIRLGDEPLGGDEALTECDENKTSANCEVVDKLFYRSSEKIVLIAKKYQLDDERFYKDEKPISDHYPLFVEMDFQFNP